MVIARDPSRLIDYVLKEDRGLPKEKQTVWKLRHLLNRERAPIEDSIAKMSKDGSYSFKAGSYPVDICKMGLRGWDNFQLPDGTLAQPEFTNSGMLKEKCLDLLKPAWIAELADVITEKNLVSEEEEKNS
jgi:hypothetical protein